MLFRKITENLIKWKLKPDRKPLLITGARQVGKTYAIDNFCKENYENYVRINFEQDFELKKLFDKNYDIERIINEISLFKRCKFVKNKTIIFFDEIQECDKARASLKYFYMDKRFDVICSGSLLGIKFTNRAPIPVGYEEIINLLPLDFEEFLLALGKQKESIDYLKKLFKEKNTVPSYIHKEMLELFKKYIVIGGMPEVVKTFIETSSYSEVWEKQTTILHEYADDIVKYTTKVEKPKVLKTFSSITKNLSRTYTKFKFSEIEESAKSGKYLSSVDWLIASNILTPCYNLTQLSTPLSANKIDSEFKLYFNDIGLLIANYGDVTLQEQIFNDKIGDAKGGIYENVLGCILRSMGYKLFYFKKFESTKDKQFEIDFIINDANYIYTIEMKSTNSKSKSLSKVLELTNKKNIKGFKLVSGNVGTGKDFDVIPFYFSIFLP